jgi:hypothetical protein
MKLEIIYTEEISGCCPVQAEGTINGLPFYFRSRGEHWSLYIALTKYADPLDRGDGVWRHKEQYPPCADEEPVMIHGHPCKFAAGSATTKECAEFIEMAAELFIEQHKTNA